ncbi:hypothetical protein HDE_00551 [Halotydeus destructor]|nr:hypothetical protein HDE_00551 [Halotydeus destructor]
MFNMDFEHIEPEQANEANQRNLELITELRMNCDYFKNLSASSQKVLFQEQLEHRDEVTKMAADVKRLRESNEHLIREMSSLRDENKNLTRDIYCLKKKEFELLADLQEYEQLQLSGSAVAAKMAEAKLFKIEAEAIRRSAKEVIAESRAEKDCRAEDELLITTLKREKEILHRHYDDKCRRLDCLTAIVKQQTEQLEESAITVDLMKTKIQEMTSTQERELSAMNDNCFNLHKVIIRLHERLLSVLATSDGDCADYDEMRQKLPDVMREITAANFRQKPDGQSGCYFRQRSVSQGSGCIRFEVPGGRSCPINIQNPRTKCPVTNNTLYCSYRDFVRHFSKLWPMNISLP